MGKLTNFASSVKSKALSLAVNLGVMSYPVVIDISYCQAVANIDWARLKELGVAVIMRMGQNIWEDNLFRAHYTNAVKYGVPFGVYWFYQPDQPPTLQIVAFLKSYNSLPIKPKVICLDVENISYWEDLIGEDGKPVMQDGKPMQILINITPPNATVHSIWLWIWLTEIEKATGNTPGIYTRADYWNLWTLRIYDWAHFFLWIASWTNYSSNIRMPLDWKVWTVWQWIGGENRQDGVIGPVDGNYFNGSQANMVAYFTVETPKETLVTNTYKTDVLINDRAFGTALTIDDPREDMPAIAAASNFVMLQVGGSEGQPGSGNELHSDGDTFRIRADRAHANGLMVGGWFTLDAGYCLWREFMFDGVSDYRKRPFTASETLKTFLETWRKLGTFGWDKLNADDGNWHPMDMIVLSVYETTTHIGKGISGAWQVAVIDDMVKYLKILMDGGYIPQVPVYVYSVPGFFQKYDTDLSVYLNNSLINKSISGIGMGDPLWPQIQSADTWPLAEVSKSFRYSNEYKYPFVPFGCEGAVKFFMYSWDRFLVKEVMNRDGSPRTVAVITWCDTPAGMKKELNFGVVVPAPVEPPPPPPPIDPPPVEPPLESGKLDKILALVLAIYDKLIAFFDWLKKFAS